MGHGGGSKSQGQSSTQSQKVPSTRRNRSWRLYPILGMMVVLLIPPRLFFFRVVPTGIYTSPHLERRYPHLIISIYCTWTKQSSHGDPWRPQLSTAQHIYLSLSIDTTHTYTRTRTATFTSMVGVARYHEDFIPSGLFRALSGRQTPLLFFFFSGFRFFFGFPY